MYHYVNQGGQYWNGCIKKQNIDNKRFNVYELIMVGPSTQRTAVISGGCMM